MVTKRKLSSLELRRLVERLTPLVKRIARRLMRTLPTSVEADDLVQDGMVGLMGALLRSTRETTGQQFDSYVSQCVRGAMLDGLRANDQASRRVRHDMRQVEIVMQRLGHQLGRQPTEGEVSAALGISIAEYQSLLQEVYGYSLVSLEDLVEQGDGDEYLAYCADNNLSPVGALERSGFQQVLIAAIRALPKQEKQVMTHYYEAERNMSEIASRLGLTEGRISQIHAQAIARLRAAVLGGDQRTTLLAPRRKKREPV
ncbi:MAG: RNA polymerase sigma factor FliA [Rhodocyclaceae bacterium]|nr:RNA polymerase sigma factor FliA [Rhodocyclaceae bacterium]